MALVTVTGNVTDITGLADPDPLTFFADDPRDGVLSTRRQKVVPNNSTGAFSVQLAEGPAKVYVRGREYAFTAAAGDLWSLIKVGIAIPPETPAERLQDAVESWAQSYADARYATPASVTATVDALKTLIIGPNAPATLDTIAEIAAALGNDPQMVSNLVTTVAGKYSKPSSGIPLSDLKKADLDGAYAPVDEPVAKARVARKSFAAATSDATLTLSPGAFDQVDASGGSRTRKLAAGANVDDQVTVKVTAITAGNTVTVSGDTGVTASTITLTALNQAVTFSWTGSAWVVSGRDNPTTYLNATFAPIRQEYVALARTPDALISGTITRDANGAATAAPVTWPDGTPGQYTATAVSTAFPGAVDAYTVTYGSPTTKTYTQPAVTRDATTGAVTQAPAMVVS